MVRIVLPLLAFAGDALAHPGHGATALHLHDLELGHWALALAMAAVAGIVAWRSR